ncbi:MAG TPA: glutaredoxin family protein [Deltaproteobacteria bacterium]|nr:glutaredoxin family protein [Deltaproteobacteria bacterium]HOM29333.1 glutaredoxin family protein [Deltaproteobacteria bacterium]HPP81071.1 glutaredoxin family protein [Deltaproteobacteria bacterium]
MKKSVMMFTLSTCSHCKAAKRFLNEHNVEFSFKDVDLLEAGEREEALDEVRGYNPKLTFPTIVIDGRQVIVGFQDREIKEALGL